jgi:hypothetical protein
LSAASALTATASWQTVNHQASAPADYVAASGTVSFAPGQTSKTVGVTIKGDTLDEKNEQLLVLFTNPTKAVIGGFGGAGAVTILDDDAPPVVEPHNASILEGNSGTKVLLIPVRLTAPSGRRITVSWTTQNNTATAPSDFAAASGTVTFKTGQTQKTVAVTIKGDTLKEANERFFVVYSNPTNVTIGTNNTGSGTILNND